MRCVLFLAETSAGPSPNPDAWDTAVYPALYARKYRLTRSKCRIQRSVHASWDYLESCPATLLLSGHGD